MAGTPQERSPALLPVVTHLALATGAVRHCPVEMDRESKVPEGNPKIKAQGLVGNKHVRSVKPVLTFSASGEMLSNSE